MSTSWQTLLNNTQKLNNVWKLPVGIKDVLLDTIVSTRSSVARVVGNRQRQIGSVEVFRGDLCPSVGHNRFTKEKLYHLYKFVCQLIKLSLLCK